MAGRGWDPSLWASRKPLAIGKQYPNNSLLMTPGGDFVKVLPHPDYGRQGPERVLLRAHMDVVPSSRTRVEPREAVVLPAQTRYEIDSLVLPTRDAALSQEEADSLTLRNGDAVVLRGDSAKFRWRALLAPVSLGSAHVHRPGAEVLIDPKRRSPRAGIPDYDPSVTLPRRDPNNRGLTTTLNQRAKQPNRGKHVFS